jgi:hypothetical protein
MLTLEGTYAGGGLILVWLSHGRHLRYLSGEDKDIDQLAIQSHGKYLRLSTDCRLDPFILVVVTDCEAFSRDIYCSITPVSSPYPQSIGLVFSVIPNR